MFAGYPVKCVIFNFYQIGIIVLLMFWLKLIFGLCLDVCIYLFWQIYYFKGYSLKEEVLHKVSILNCLCLVPWTCPPL